MIMNVKSYTQGRAVMWVASCQYGGLAYSVTDDTPGKAAAKLNELVVPDGPAPIGCISDTLEDRIAHHSGRPVNIREYLDGLFSAPAAGREGHPPDVFAWDAPGMRKGRRIAEDNYADLARAVKASMRVSPGPKPETVDAITAMASDIRDLKEQVLALSVRITQDAPHRDSMEGL